ncbi:MAG: Catabolite control protein A [Lentisphaerae bacterium ADurb.Bin242]|nr:MAG: Catabolite control protein A [Lentisphaerae bacterium ADurb.Bin242]
MSVTLKDVARLAQTDITSVSVTLRNTPQAAGLKESTRNRIIEAARYLGYTRNAFAAAMRTGKNPTVGVILNSKATGDNIFENQALFGILHEAALLSYGISVYTDEDIKGTIQSIIGHQIRNVVSISFSAPKREEAAGLCRQHGLNLVFVTETSQGGFPAVDIDNFGGVYKAITSLIRFGHRRIAYLTSLFTMHFSRERFRGYKQALADAGIEFNPDWVVQGEDLDRFLSGILPLRGNRRPDAIFAMEDNLAVFTESLLLKAGLRVPEDISVMGFGNYAGYNVVVPISTVTAPFNELGKNAMRLLLGKRNTALKKTAAGDYLLPMEVLHRSSVRIPEKIRAEMRSAGEKICNIFQTWDELTHKNERKA